MSSGRQMLAEIDHALTQSRMDFRKLDVELQSASAELARHKRREASIYQQLAHARLSDLIASTFDQAIDQADKRAATLLTKREQALETLQQDIGTSEQRLEVLTTQRESHNDQLDNAELALDEKLAEVDRALQQDPTYLEKRSTAQRDLDIAANAAAKTSEAQARLEDKRQAFEADKLFMYLWSRHYGTGEYRANPIARLMDRQVAGHIRFEAARQNYFMLNEVPRQLAAHTARLDEKAADSASTLADYERETDIASGALPLEEAVNDAERTLAATDQNIDEEQETFTELVRQREQFATANDPMYVEAMAVLDEQFRAEPIPQLQREAMLTSSAEDDELVDQLSELRIAQSRVAQYLDDHRDLHNRRAARVNSLADIRRRYKKRNYDAYNSLIDSQSRVSTILGEFMRGIVSDERLWSSIRHAQRFRKTRRQRSYGGQRIGGASIPRMPRGVRIPRSSGRSRGGGFRTKGGF